MKKYLFLLMLCFCCLFSGGCGRQEASSSPEGTEDFNETKEYYDIMVENTAFPELDRTDQALYFLGMQFYRGEAVQLWGQRHFDEAGGGNVGEIFRYKMDGSRENAAANVPSEYLVSFTQGFQDSEGNLYFWGKNGFHWTSRIKSSYWIMDDENLTTKLAKSRSGALPEEMWDMRQWYAGGSISFYGNTCLGGKGDEPCYSRLLKSGLGKIWS